MNRNAANPRTPGDGNRAAPPGPGSAIDAEGRLDPVRAVSLLLSLTKRCNMRCPGCYLSLQEENFFKNQEVGVEDAKTIVSTYRDLGIRQVAANAEGEVLLHPHYREIVAFINRQGLPAKPWTVTNGILLPRHADFVVRNVCEVLVSVDGATAERYNAFRGGNGALFAKVIRGIQAVVEARKRSPDKPHLMINCVITVDRCNEMPDMIRFAETAGVDSIKFTNFHPAGDGTAHRPLYFHDRQQMAMLDALLRRNDYRVNVRLPNVFGRVSPPFRCQMLSSIVVGSNGDLSPCCRLIPEPKWGNLFSDPEKHDSVPLRAFRRAVTQAASFDDLPPICTECSHLSPRPVHFVRDQRRWYLRTDRPPPRSAARPQPASRTQRA